MKVSKTVYKYNKSRGSWHTRAKCCIHCYTHTHIVDCWEKETITGTIFRGEDTMDKWQHFQTCKNRTPDVNYFKTHLQS